MKLAEFTFLAVGSLFVILDPIGVVPAFLAMTPHDSPRERTRMARLACLVAGGVLVSFAIVGQRLFKVFGITLPAFRIAGGIVLLLIALDMLRARRSPVYETAEETDEGAAKEDIAVTPLAVPMLAGPGAISTAILLRTQAAGWAQQLALIGGILFVCGLTYIILRLAAYGVRWISPLAMKIATRIMGLLLAAVAIQFILNGLAEQKAALI